MTRPLKKKERDRLIAGYCTTAPPGVKAKRGFPTKSAAKRGMKGAASTGARRPGSRHELGVYQCRCGLWHVTSQEKRS